MINFVSLRSYNFPTVTPAAMSEEQTISTLRFASEAKKIQNHAKVNEVLDNQATISRLKKENEELKRQMDLQKSTNMLEMVEEMREQLEAERREKENQLKLNEELRSKIITSSQPAPPRKSHMPHNVNKKSRRETWCGPAMRKNMRMSMAAGAFLKPLPKVDFLAPGGSLIPTLSTTQDDFMDHLISEEEEKLVEIEEENETSHLKVVPRKRKNVNFVNSPQFCSPRRKISNSLIDLNTTDEGGTPKAIIRDKYKRVSLALNSREVELERERMARQEAESELQELQEFTRLEDESGVTQERQAPLEEVFVHEKSDQVKFLERSFKDAERLNLELTKELNDKRQELNVLLSKHHELQSSHEMLLEKDKSLEAKVIVLEPLVTEVKTLKEKSEILVRNEQDFEIRLKLAVNKKDSVIEDLKKCLDSVYDEISLLESGNKEDIKKRFQKMSDLQEQVTSLQQALKDNEASLSEAQIENKEDEKLKEQVCQLSTHLATLSKEKTSLITEIESLKSSAKESSGLEELRIELESTKKVLAEKDSIFSNMELSNESLLENIDKLNKDFEEVNQKHTNLLVLNRETETFNSELREEIDQLKLEITDAKNEKEKFEIENVDMKIEIEEVKSMFAEKENEVSRFGELLQSKGNEIEKVKDDLKVAFDEKENLEARLLEMKSSLEKVSHEKTRIENELKELAFVKVNETTNAINLQDELAAATGNPLEIETSVMEEAKLEESSNLQEEIDRLKAELLFANEEKQKLEDELSSRPTNGTRSFLEKLSATLTCIEESFVASPEADMSTSILMDESTANKTISSTGITVETVQEIKNQLLALQEKITAFDPDELKAKESQIMKLTEENAEMSKKLANLDSSPALPAESSSIHDDYEDKMKEMRKQHQAQLSVITNKMGEEMKTNLVALEEKLREEYDAKTNFSKACQSQEHEDMVSDLRKHHLEEIANLRLTLQEESKTKLDVIEKDLREEILKLKENSSNLKSSILVEHEAKIQTLQSQHQTLVDDLNQEITKLRAESVTIQLNFTQDLQEAQESLKTQHDDYEEKVSDLRKHHFGEMDQLRSELQEEFNTNRDALEKDLREEMLKLKENSSNLRSSILEEHDLKIQTIQSQHKSLVNDLNQEITKLRADNVTIQSNFNQDLRENLESQKSQHHEVESNLRQEVTRLENELSLHQNRLQNEMENKLMEASKAQSNLEDVKEQLSKLRDTENMLREENTKMKESLGNKLMEASEAQSNLEDVKEQLSRVKDTETMLREENTKMKDSLEKKLMEASKAQSNLEDSQEQLSRVKDMESLLREENTSLKEALGNKLTEASKVQSILEDDQEQLSRLKETERILREENASMKEALEFIEAEKVNTLTQSETSLGRLKEALAHKTLEFDNLFDKYESEGIALKEKEIELCEEYEEQIEQLKIIHQQEVEAVSSKTREEFLSHISSLESQLSSVVEMKSQLSRHKQFEEQLYMENSKLKDALKSKPSVNLQELEDLRRQHEVTVTTLKEELGNKNIELASLKVDIERGELHYKKRCEVLQVSKS